MDFERKGSRLAGEGAATGGPARPAPGRTTAVEVLQRKAAAGASLAPAASGPPAPAYDKEPTNAPGAFNYNSTIDWDKKADLFGLDGPADETLRTIYEGHLRGEMSKDPRMLELGAQGMPADKVKELGARIARIADGTEALWVGAVEKKGAEAALPYRQALWRCTQRAIIATLATSKSRRYKKTKDTYCNVYSADMVNAMGGYLPLVWYNEDLATTAKVPAEKLQKNNKGPLNANQIGLWLHKWGKDYGWRQIDDPKQAQTEANSGKVVIIQASKADPKYSGHVNVIIAEGNGHEAQKGHGGYQPLQSQAGDSNYEYSDTAEKTNGLNWWTAPGDGSAAQGADAMAKDPGGNFWIYEGAHHADTAVGSATEMGSKAK